MVENRFEVGFYFNSEDQQIAKLAKSKDIKALTNYLQQTPVTALSEESLSTAFATLAKARELDQAVSLMERVMRAYVESSAPAQRHQLERALVWMAKSQPTHKAKLEDDLAMALARRIQPTQAAGAALVKALPTDFVKEWANNLDLTISQGGAWAMISPDDREMANRLLTLKGLPANKRVI